MFDHLSVGVRDLAAARRFYDAFFAPLARLRAGDTRVFLGVIHNMERFGERVATARKYLGEFGLAGFCGFGRMPAADMPQVLDAHLRALELAAS